MSLKYPVLVISYQQDARATIEASLQQEEVHAVVCSTFLEAETRARDEVFNGVLVDLTSMVKAKGEEKVIACSMTGFYPTLRVRTMGSMLVPMIMPGQGRQEKSLKDFLVKACAEFQPRTLRAHRRHDLCLAAVLHQGERTSRTFTLDLSWGGAFFIDLEAERFSVGEELEVEFPDFGISVPLAVRWVRTWGGRRPPGIGCSFLSTAEEFLRALGGVLKTSRDQDRDRMVA